MHSKYILFFVLIKRAKAKIRNLEACRATVNTSILNLRINHWRDMLSIYKKELKYLSGFERYLNKAITNEIREMVITISQNLGHELKETPQGFFVFSGDKKLKISKSGFIRHWFSVKSFSDFDDYELWIEEIRIERKGTPVANHVEYHVFKTKHP